MLIQFNGTRVTVRLKMYVYRGMSKTIISMIPMFPFPVSVSGVVHNKRATITLAGGTERINLPLRCHYVVS